MNFSSRHRILVTGGAGYIGSHSAVALHEAGFTPLMLDNLSNAKLEAIEGVRALCGDPELPFYNVDVRDESGLRAVFEQHEAQGQPIVGMLHFAAHKAVGESVEQPARYATNNVGGLGTLLHVANEFNVRNVVFSSSCTVYGEPESVPVDESTPFKKAESPYGWTKQACERVLTDHAATHPHHRIALLRYFNPIGAHPSARIGEWPLGVPNNLVPFLTQTVAGIRESLTVFGDDYPTQDGTCVRDYLHVMDLAEAHVAALNWCLNQNATGPVVRAFNLGTGKGASVLEVIQRFEQATGLRVPHHIGPRREGDVVAIWANADRAKSELNWVASRDLETCLADAWRWQEHLKKG